MGFLNKKKNGYKIICFGLTVLFVIENLEVLLGARKERFPYCGYGVGRRHWSVEKLADRRSLHDFGPREARQTAKAVRTVYYVT